MNCSTKSQITSSARYMIFVLTVVSQIVASVERDQFLSPSITKTWIEPSSQRIETSKVLRGRVKIEGTVDIGAEVGGPVERIFVSEGNNVAQGDSLLKIDSSRFQATVDLRRAQLESTLANLEASRFRLEEAELRLRRAQELETGIAISQSQLDSLTYNVKVLRAELRAIESDVKIAEAALEEAQVDLGRTVIKAPTSGEVIQKNIEIGETINVRQSSPTLFQITPQNSAVSISSEAPEQHIKYLSVGKPVQVYSQMLPPAGVTCGIGKIYKTPIFRGEFVYYGLLIECDNAPKGLWAGMTVDISVLFQSDQPRSVIPASSLLYIPPESNGAVRKHSVGFRPLWVKDKDGSLQLRSVAVGLSNSECVEIVGGDLQETDRVYNSANECR